MRCSKCVLPDTYPGIHLHPEGVCDFCRQPVPVDPPLRSRDELLAKIQKHRNPDSDYDCMVALSGGRDSTYVLYHAVRVLGLRVLAYTIDHGLLPAHTHANIQNAVRILGVPHVMDQHDLVMDCIQPMLSAWLKRPSARTISMLCLGCRQAMWVGIGDAARRHGTPVVLNGTGEAGVHDYLATRFFTTRAGGWQKHAQIAAGFGWEILRNPWFLTKPSVMKMMTREYMHVMSPRRQRENFRDLKVVPLFESVRWNEHEIVTTITNELDWKKAPESEASWRSDCKIALLKNQLYMLTSGFSLNDSMVSDLVRRGVLTREQAMERLERENVINEDILRDLLWEVGIGVPGLVKAARPESQGVHPERVTPEQLAPTDRINH